ncbi:hypothetical protein MASR2M78_06240 [Treponema sp.]
MKEIRFSRSFSASEQRQYVNIPFDVPAGIDRIEFFYEYPRFRDETRKEGSARIEANIVDLGIYDDSNSLRGWSGSQRYEAFVSESSATPGYKNGPIRPGSWAIALGIYKVESKVTVDVTIRLIPKARILLAGDIHMHTLNSDGDYPTTQVIRILPPAWLGFYGLNGPQQYRTEQGNR